MTGALVLLFAALAAGPPSQAGGASDVDNAYSAAMAPYYAALVTSARGDADGTLRHVIVLKSKWEELVRRSSTNPPSWIREPVDGVPLGRAIGQRIEAVRSHLPSAVARAHEELEGIRVLLRDARSKTGTRTVDDAVTDYHDAMERLVSHAGESNEVALRDRDFSTIGEDIGPARSAWLEVETGLGHAIPRTADLMSRTRALLIDIGAAAERHEAKAVQHACRELKARYLDLLAALSRRS